MRKILLTSVGVISIISLSAQCSVIEIPLAQRAAASSAIVEGRVTAQNSYWNTDHTMIYTANTIELYKIFKGSIATTEVEVITEGGTVGLNRIAVEPSLELSIGQEGMFTLVPVTRAKNLPMVNRNLPRYEAYASVQGVVRYDLIDRTASDPFRTYSDIQTEVYDVCAPPGHHQYIEVKPVDITGTQARVGDPPAVQSISSFSPTTITAGTGSQLTITGTSFGSSQGSGVVRFRNADDGGATTITPLATQYISWSNTQIVVEVPQNAGTGTIQVVQGSTFTSTQTLTITYAHLNVEFDPGTGTEAYGTDHIDDNGSGGYTWRMNTGFDGNASANAAFIRAFDEWRCYTGVNWTIGATTSINDAVSDGTNVICFDNTAPLSAGILGVCYSYWSGCASGPTIVWYVSELDIIFDEGSNISPLTWEYGPALPSGSEYDFETVAVHELGHGHQLGHIINSGAIMHYSISNGTSNRDLDMEDQQGGDYVQSKSEVANVCGPGAMTTYSCVSPPVAAFSGTPTTLCSGNTVAFTDQSTNTPTSWSWTFTGGTPSSSTQQNPTITYNTPGTYAVSLTATNSAGSDVETINGYITVNSCGSPPVAAFTGSPTTLCAGETVNFTDQSTNSPTSWSWTFTGGTPSSSTAQNPTITYNTPGTYAVSLTATNAFGSDAETINGYITVNANPTVSFTSNPSPATVCAGEQVTLSGSGATSYSWTGGVTNGVAFTPASSQNYTVTGTDGNGCTGTAVASVTVNANPTVSFSSNPSPATVCAGEQVTLNGSGATSYSWTGGVTNGVAFTPASSQNYTVTGTDGNGCTGTAVASVTVNATPTLSIVSNPSNGIVCSGNQATLTASGAQSYSWTGGITNGVAFTPASTTTYTVTGTGANGCTSQSQATITVNNCSFATSTVPCGTTITNKNQTRSAANVVGATQYRFTFYDNSTLAQVAQVTQASRTLTFTNVPSIYYGTTYRWTVAVNTGSGFGPESSINCTITLAAPQTTLLCGMIYNGFNAYTGVQARAGVTNYIFRFYDNTTLALVTTRTQTSNYLYFNQLSGLQLGNTYRWTVQIEYPSGPSQTAFGPESSINCAVTFGAPSTYVSCGVTYNGFNGYTAAQARYGAVNYIFRFYNNSTLALVTSRTQTSNYLYFNQVSGLVAGTTYRLTVQVEYTTGSQTAFGPESSINCTVTFAAPTTTVPCNNTYNASGGVAGAVYVYGSTGYRFTFYQNSVQVAQRAQASNYIYFSQVAGIANGNTYQWTVEVQYNNGVGLVYGPASAMCNVTFSGLARMAQPDSADISAQFPAFGLLMYPNPLGNNVAPKINITGADQQEAYVSVIDLTGRTVTTYWLFVEGDNYTTELAGFPELEAGMYIMQMQIGEQVQSQRFVAE